MEYLLIFYNERPLMLLLIALIFLLLLYSTVGILMGNYDYKGWKFMPSPIGFRLHKNIVKFQAELKTKHLFFLKVLTLINFTVLMAVLLLIPHPELNWIIFFIFLPPFTGMIFNSWLSYSMKFER